MQLSDLTQLEDNTLDHLRHDGMGEIHLAVFWLLLAWTVPLGFDMLRLLIFVACFTVLEIPLLMFWRRKVVYPRIGYAKPRKDVRDRLSSAFVRRGLTIVLVMMIVFMAAGVANKMWHLVPPLPPGAPRPGEDAEIAFFTMLVLAATQGRRSSTVVLLAAWGILLHLTSTVLHVTPIYGMLISAAVALILGIRKLHRFFKENPRLDTEVAE